MFSKRLVVTWPDFFWKNCFQRWKMRVAGIHSEKSHLFENILSENGNFCKLVVGITLPGFGKPGRCTPQRSALVRTAWSLPMCGSPSTGRQRGSLRLFSLRPLSRFPSCDSQPSSLASSQPEVHPFPLHSAKRWPVQFSMWLLSAD